LEILTRTTEVAVSADARVSPEEPLGIERPADGRFPILQRCLVRPVGPTLGLPGSGPGTEAWRCIAYNLSPVGVGITMPFPPPRGTVLEIQPWNLPAGRPVQARVVRTSSVEFLWFCGCEFLRPLDPAELHAWLAQPQN
jgi:hypothetical protein